MALKGTLKDFSVADIFQLIGQQQKSGSLYVRQKEKETHIVFDKGKVVLGTFRKSDEDFLLGTMLLRANAINSAQLTLAMENQKVSMRSLGDILKSMGAITNATLSEFVALQLKEVLFRLFQWKDGLYEFVAEQVNYNRTILKPLSSEAVLMDGFRMLDEWPVLIERVETLEGVFLSKVDSSELEEAKKNAEAGDDDIDFGMGEPKSGGPSFSADELKILPMLNGQRSLQEVIYLSRLGTFDTVSAMAGLLSRGKAVKVDQLAQTRFDVQTPIKETLTFREWLTGSVRYLLVIFALSLCVPLIAFGIRSNWSARYTLTETTRGIQGPAALSIKELALSDQRQRIETLLQLYLLERGTMPPSLEQLSNESWLKPWKLVSDGSGDRIVYQGEPR